MASLPIGDYALISDCHTAALVSRAGSVDWLCFPRFDGLPVFAQLLDDQGGHCWVRVAGATATRRYLPGTMTLETTFRTAGGTAVLVDAMAVGRNERGHELGAGSPGALLRPLTCTEGTVGVEVEYASRPEYGIVFPLLAQVDGGVMARGGADVLHLSFERAGAYANDVALLAEEVDPVTNEPIGNYPQAFSHIGLVNAAWAIHQAEGGG
jgi:alpha,alpha-trehalase